MLWGQGNQVGVVAARRPVHGVASAKFPRNSFGWFPPNLCTTGVGADGSPGTAADLEKRALKQKADDAEALRQRVAALTAENKGHGASSWLRCLKLSG